MKNFGQAQNEPPKNKNKKVKQMKKQKTLIGVSLAILGLVLTQVVVKAGITGVPLGQSAPPSTLGGFSMAAFPADLVNPVYPTSYLDVTSVPGPGGSTLTFSQALTHDLAGDINTGWQTWSHGYTGDVYDTIGASDPISVTLGLPGGTRAFYLYAEPAPYQSYTITATAQDGTSISSIVDGQGGAEGYGFYTDLASFITSIKVESVNTDFAVGEFGISAVSGINPVPEPSTYLVDAFMFLPFGIQWIRCRRNRKPVCE